MNPEQITQELVNNIIKHSKAKKASLKLNYINNKIILLATDDGIGFDAEANNKGYGLKNLDVRSQLVSGKVKINSKPGFGTEIAIEIPYGFSLSKKNDLEQVYRKPVSLSSITSKI